MASRERPRRRSHRRLLLPGGPLLAAAGLLAALLAGGGSSAGASPASAPSYTALASTEPSGLAIVQEPAPLGSPQAATPSFPAQPPAGSSGWPVASTIRRLSLTAPGLSAWIARSSEGGICVLLYDGQPVHGVAALDIGCSTPEGLTRGAEVEVSEIPGLPGETIAAGVVPDGVSSVSQTMADGSTVRSTVSGNAWARISAVPAAPGEQPNETIGG